MSIGRQSGCSRSLCSRPPCLLQHCRIDSLKPLVVGVLVRSWSRNWPHCITIIVNWVVRCSTSLWMVADTRRGLGRGPLDRDRLNDSIPSLKSKVSTGGTRARVVLALQAHLIRGQLGSLVSAAIYRRLAGRP